MGDASSAELKNKRAPLIFELHVKISDLLIICTSMIMIVCHLATSFDIQTNFQGIFISEHNVSFLSCLCVPVSRPSGEHGSSH